MTNSEAPYVEDEVQRLLDYATTADIAGDPLVVDLVAALTRATNKLTAVEDIMQRFREGGDSSRALLDIDLIIESA